jgi:DNA-binding LacI/PurR family transcriptional regulator
MPRADFDAVTIEDVARRAAVSRATAARVLAGHSNVSPSARQRVMAAAAELGYVANPIARALATGQGNRVVIGVVSPRPTVVVDAYLGRVVGTAARMCSEAGMGVGLQALPLDGGVPLVKLAQDRAVRGLLMVNTTDSILRAMPGSLSRRVVSIGVGSAQVPSIDVDNGAGATAIIRHLYESGRRRISMVGGPPWLPCTARPLLAYRRLMQEYGLAERSLAGDFTADNGRAAAHEVMRRWPGTDAIYAICDDAALGVIKGLQEQGIDVPGDVAVAGFDDTPQAELAYPPLTTASHPVELITEAAVTTLLASGPARPLDRAFQPELVLRQSA